MSIGQVVGACILVLALFAGLVFLTRRRLARAPDSEKPRVAAGLLAFEALQMISAAALVSAALTWAALFILTRGQGASSLEVAAAINRIHAVASVLEKVRLGVWIWAFVLAGAALLFWISRTRRAQFDKARQAIALEKFNRLVEQFNRGELPPKEPSAEMAPLVQRLAAANAEIAELTQQSAVAETDPQRAEIARKLQRATDTRRSTFENLALADIRRRVEIPPHDPDLVGLPPPARGVAQRIGRVFLSRGMFRQLNIGQRLLLLASVLLVVPSLLTLTGSAIADGLQIRMTELDSVRVDLAAQEAEARYEQAAKELPPPQNSPADAVDDQTFVHIAHAHAQAFEGAVSRNVEKRFKIVDSAHTPSLADTEAALRQHAAREQILEIAAADSKNSPPDNVATSSDTGGPGDTGGAPGDQAGHPPPHSPPPNDLPPPGRQLEVHVSLGDGPPIRDFANRLAAASVIESRPLTPAGEGLAQEIIARGGHDVAFREAVVRSWRAATASFFQAARPVQLRGVLLAAALGGSSESAAMADVVAEPIAIWAQAALAPSAQARIYRVNTSTYLAALLRTNDPAAALAAVEDAPYSNLTDVEADAARSKLVANIEPDADLVKDLAKFPASLVEVHDGISNEAYEKASLGDYYKDLAVRRSLDIPPARLDTLVAEAPARGSYDGFFPPDIQTAERYAAAEGRAAGGAVEAAESAASWIGRARSFALLRGFSRVGGVLIGRDPDTGAPLDIRKFDWSTDGSGITLKLGTADGHVTSLGPFHASVASLALAYAADGRVLTATMTKADPLQELRILLHPALVDTPLGCRAIAIDRFVDESTSHSLERSKRAVLIEVQTWLYAVARDALIRRLFEADVAKDLTADDADITAQAEQFGGKNPPPDAAFTKSVFDEALNSPDELFSPSFSPLTVKTRYYHPRVVEIMQTCAKPGGTFDAYNACVRSQAQTLGDSQVETLKKGGNINWTAPTPKYETWSGVRERPYKLDPTLDFVGAGALADPPAPLEFMIQISFTSPPYAGLDGPWFSKETKIPPDDSEPWTFPDAGIDTTASVLGLIKNDAEDQDVFAGVREFVWSQRLFRAALSGGLGPNFPVGHLTELAKATRPAVKPQRTVRWNVRTPPEMALLANTIQTLAIPPVPPTTGDEHADFNPGDPSSSPAKRADPKSAAAEAFAKRNRETACLAAVGIDFSKLDPNDDKAVEEALVAAEGRLYDLSDDAWDKVCRFAAGTVPEDLVEASIFASDLRRLRHALGLRDDEKLVRNGLKCDAL